MTNSRRHTRILPVACAEAFQYGTLVEFHEETLHKRRDLIITVRNFHPEDAGELMWQEGRPAIRQTGRFRLHRVRFQGITWKEAKGAYRDPANIPADDPARDIVYLLHWMTPKKEEFYYLSSDPDASLFFRAGRSLEEAAPEEDDPSEPVSLTRYKLPAPFLPARLIPSPQQLYSRFGGDPVAIRLRGKEFSGRLFVGGIENQGDTRPDVDAVLNLSEELSPWQCKDGFSAADRWVNKGEGSRGMRVDEIVDEAKWVAERLYAGKRALVHCSAGFNRSSTMCCAVLILLEGLRAEAALERVREHHPWALPDAYHWLALKYIAERVELPGIYGA